MAKLRRISYGVLLMIYLMIRINIYLYQGNSVNFEGITIASTNTQTTYKSFYQDVTNRSYVTNQTKFVVLPKSFSVNRKPTKETENFIIRPSSDMTSSEKGEIFLLFFVKSSCGGYKRRENVRRTWGMIRSINGHRIVVIFLIGRCENPNLETQILHESLKFGDILQPNTSDHYKALPSKVLSGYQWATEEGLSHVVFYATTDDDCLIKLPALFDYYITNRDFLVQNQSVNCGFRYNDHAQPHRNKSSKYLVSKQVYDLDFYPTFCHGGLVVMTYELMRDIYRMSEITNRNEFFLEDVYINGILREKLGHNNINKIGSFGLKGEYVSTDDVVVHLGNSKILNLDFQLEWTKVLQLMTLKVGSKTFQGYKRSSKYLLAKGEGDVKDLKSKFLPKIKNSQGRISELLKMI